MDKDTAYTLYRRMSLSLCTGLVKVTLKWEHDQGKHLNIVTVGHYKATNEVL